MKDYNFIPEIEISYRTGGVEKKKISCSRDVFEILSQLFNVDTLELKEEAIAIFLNRANKTLGWYRISTGGVSGTVMDVRPVLAIAIKSASSGLIIAHNHPSGNMQPSKSDEEITKKFRDAGKLIDCILLDHLIICENNYFSFADNGLI